MIATTMGAQVIRTAPAGQTSAIIVGCEGLLLAGLGAGLRNELQREKRGSKTEQQKPPAP
jgi:hypothetical protein